MVIALLRQGILGFIIVALSLPILWAAHRAMNLGSPPLAGVLLLGASVVLACAMGGVLGVVIGQSRRSEGSNAMILAALSGLLCGGVFCAIVLPLYAQSVVDELSRAAVSTMWNERGQFFNRDLVVGKSVESARTLAWNGAARLPALSLLFWTFFGPAISGAFEALIASRRKF